MNVYTILDSVYNSDQYKGSGHAIVASVNKQVVKIVYIYDIDPDFDPQIFDIKKVINDPRVAPIVRELSALGSVHFGMCSSGEFIEL